MEQYQNSVQDTKGNALPALIQVAFLGTNNLAPIFSDNGVTPKGNPFPADDTGEYRFYAANGRYTITVSYQDKFDRVYDALMYDPVDSPLTAQSLKDDLANNVDPAKGDALVAVKQPYTGSVARTQHQKNIDTLTFEDFGAIGDGVADDTIALQKAFTSGRGVRAANSKQIYRITVALHCMNSAQDIDFAQAELRLDDPTGLQNHIVIGDNITKVNGVRILRCRATRVQAATGISAVILGIFVGLIYIIDCRFYGDNKFWNAIEIRRGIQIYIWENLFEHTLDDCIKLSGTGDGADETIQVEIIHNQFDRPVGACINMGEFVEGTYVKDNIFFGNSGPNPCMVMSRVPTVTTSGASHKIEGNDFDTIAGSAALYLHNYTNVQILDNWFSNNAGINIRADENCNGIIIDANQFYGLTSASSNLEIWSDQTIITGNLISGGKQGILLKSVASRALIDGNMIQFQTDFGVNLFEAPTEVQIGTNFFKDNGIRDIGGGILPTIASAATLALTAQPDGFFVSGSVGIAGISGGYVGRRVTLNFQAACVVTHSFTGAVNDVKLSGNVNFNAVSGSSLTLLHAGNQWYEIGRAL
jgi:hypothetical protein